MPNTQSTRRKRGAQPGNANAVKHGFYSRTFHGDEVNDLETQLAEGLNNEIAMMRVITRRVFDLASGAFKSTDEAINLLGALGLASSHLAGLLRSQQLTIENADNVTEALLKALVELLTKWGRK